MGKFTPDSVFSWVICICLCVLVGTCTYNEVRIEINKTDAKVAK